MVSFFLEGHELFLKLIGEADSFETLKLQFFFLPPLMLLVLAALSVWQLHIR